MIKTFTQNLFSKFRNYYNRFYKRMDIKFNKSIQYDETSNKQTIKYKVPIT